MPLLPDKIEILIKKIENVLTATGLSLPGVSILSHTIANFFRNKARAYGEEKGLSVEEITKYNVDKSKKGGK